MTENLDKTNLFNNQRYALSEWRQELKTKLLMKMYQKINIFIIEKEWLDKYEQFFLNNDENRQPLIVNNQNFELINNNKLLNSKGEINPESKFYILNENCWNLFQTDKNKELEIKFEAIFYNKILIFKISENNIYYFFCLDRHLDTRQGYFEIKNNDIINNVLKYFQENYSINLFKDKNLLSLSKATKYIYDEYNLFILEHIKTNNNNNINNIYIKNENTKNDLNIIEEQKILDKNKLNEENKEKIYGDNSKKFHKETQALRNKNIEERKNSRKDINISENYNEEIKEIINKNKKDLENKNVILDREKTYAKPNMINNDNNNNIRIYKTYIHRNLYSKKSKNQFSIIRYNREKKESQNNIKNISIKNK